MRGYEWEQPMPHDSNLMAWDELDEEQKNLFIEGCDLFDDGKFWHAHESMGRPLEIAQASREKSRLMRFKE